MATKTTIPMKTRKEIDIDPAYRVCALYGYHGHECQGKITIEHAIIYAGKKVQAKWALVPLCTKAHAVNEFQDAGTMTKSLNEWVAYSKATNKDLLELCGDLPIADPLLSKARSHFQKKKRLMSLYGVWEQKYPPSLTTGVAEAGVNAMDFMLEDIYKTPKNGIEKAKKLWFCVEPDDMKLIEDIQAYIKSQDDYHMPYPDVIRNAIKKMHDAVMELKNNVQS